jgi:antitoxin component YwqK of YwqJK toxin-antitoxin module
MKYLLIPLLSLCIACNTTQEKGAAHKADALAGSGFTNKAEAKNQLVNGLKEGKWFEYLDTTSVVEYDTVVSDTNAPYYRLGIYHAGKLSGIVRGYYKSGKLLFETHYLNGLRNGSDRAYYENGKLMYEDTLINGKANGVHKEYYETGKLEMEVLLTNDSLHLEKDYDEDGVLDRVTPITFSNRDSLRIDGIQKLYYADGKIKEEIPNVDSKINGVDREYYESGKIRSEKPYQNDRISGIQKAYYESGKLYSETPFNNNAEGATQYFLENGTLKEGKQTGYIDADFEPTQDINAPYYKITDYKAGVPYGIEKWYYKSGKLYSEVPYTNGKQNGVVKEYYESGKIEYVRPYKNGVKNGTERRFDENGVLARETIYINGEETVTKTYDTNGNEIK